MKQTLKTGALWLFLTSLYLCALAAACFYVYSVDYQNRHGKVQRVFHIGWEENAPVVTLLDTRYTLW